MTIQVDVWSDFVCPYCYVVDFGLQAMKAKYDLDIRWRSFELRPAGAPPMDPAYLNYIETTSRPRFEAMMREQFGLTVNSGKFGIVSRRALVGAKYAEAQGVGDAYHDRVKRAYWLEAQDISDDDVLVAQAEAVGLEGAAFRVALDDPQWDALVEADIEQAHVFGLNAVPALVFEGKYLVSGAQPAPVLEQVIQRVLQIKAEGASV